MGGLFMYVYFIQCCTADGYIKIGKSLNPSERLAGLATSNPYGLKILCSISFATDEGASIAERKLHKIFSDQCIRGEWFSREIYDQAIVECGKLQLEDMQINSEHKFPCSVDNMEIPSFIKQH